MLTPFLKEENLLNKHPFLKEENLLNKHPFLKDAVQFNLMHRIAEGELEIGLKRSDNNMLALNNKGRTLWLWINEAIGKEESYISIKALAEALKDKKVVEIAAAPAVSKSFAEEYSSLKGIKYRPSMGLRSYYCSNVQPPKGVEGKMIKPDANHRDIIAEFCAGFALYSDGREVTAESQLPLAEALIVSGNLYLWTVNEIAVAMANIAHRSPRHARINSVYTPPEERKKGYGSALVAAVCSTIMDEGLIPLLYADLSNPNSNKVYNRIGFVEAGDIEQYLFIY